MPRAQLSGQSKEMPSFAGKKFISAQVRINAQVCLSTHLKLGINPKKGKERLLYSILEGTLEGILLFLLTDTFSCSIN